MDVLQYERVELLDPHAGSLVSDGLGTVTALRAFTKSNPKGFPVLTVSVSNVEAACAKMVFFHSTVLNAIWECIARPKVVCTERIDCKSLSLSSASVVADFSPEEPRLTVVTEDFVTTMIAEIVKRKQLRQWFSDDELKTVLQTLLPALYMLHNSGFSGVGLSAYTVLIVATAPMQVKLFLNPNVWIVHASDSIDVKAAPPGEVGCFLVCFVVLKG